MSKAITSDAINTLRNKQIIANTVNKLRKLHHPQWSRDQLLCHPRASIRICVHVRADLPFTSDMDDFQILWAYLNASKRSKIVPGIPRRGRARIK